MTLWIGIGIAAIAVVSIIGMIYSMSANKKLQHSNVDHSANKLTAKHPVMANPILWMYVLFAAIILFIVMIFAFYYKGAY